MHDCRWNVAVDQQRLAERRKRRDQTDSVGSDVLGVSGRLMLRAMVNGERDPEVLADLAQKTLRKKIPQLREALRARFHDHHSVMLRVILDHIDYLETAIGDLDRVQIPFQ